MVNSSDLHREYFSFTGFKQAPFDVRMLAGVAPLGKVV
jgi:hypothetical protein